MLNTANQQKLNLLTSPDSNVNSIRSDMNKFEQLEEQCVKGGSNFMDMLEKELLHEKNNNVQGTNVVKKPFLKKGTLTNNIKNRYVKKNDKKNEKKNDKINPKDKRE